MTQIQRQEGGLLGLLIGDAIGVPFEFSSTSTLRIFSNDDIGLPYTLDASQFQRSHPSAPQGAWSDDGAQALALLDSLQSCQTLDLNDFSKRLLNWANQGHYAVGGAYFDIGVQTRAAFKKLEAGVKPRLAGGAEEENNGNGSLMRVLPLALWHRGDNESLVKLAMEQSLPTHGHMRSQVCCALYALWAKQLLNGAEDGFEDALYILDDIYHDNPNKEAIQELDLIMRDENKTPSGSGYVVDSLWSARDAFVKGNSYAETIHRAIRFGNDTDTTACIAGGLAGIKYGKEGIPQSWQDHLAKDERLDLCLERLRQSFIIAPNKDGNNNVDTSLKNGRENTGFLANLRHFVRSL